MRHLIRDLRYAIRGFARSPMFTGVALASLALGIGANTAVFTLVDQVLIRRLPVPHPDELVLFTSPGAHYGNNRGGNALSFPMYEDFRDAFVDRSGAQASLENGPRTGFSRVSVPYDVQTGAPLFSGLFCRYATSMNVGFNGQTERVPGELVSGTYFSVLGVRAALGRVIGPDDDNTRGGNPVAVLSPEYWRNRFGSDPQIVGKTITVNTFPLTIIGVSEGGFEGVDIGYAPSVRVPVMMKAQITPNWDDLDNRRSRWVNVFGRLKPGVTMAQATTALEPYFHGLREMEVKEAAFNRASAYTREQFLKGTIELLPAAQGRSPLRRQLAQPLWLLMATVAFVLLIACGNVASLLIARATSRQKEIAVRLALGASRGRIVGQLLAESIVLATSGGLLALLVAIWTIRFLLGFIPASETPHVISASLDLRILTFNFGLSLATGLLFGVVPALRSASPRLAPTLKDQTGTIAGGPGGIAVRKALVAVQVMLSVLLLVGAGLFIRSLRNLQLVDLGIVPESLVAFNLDPGISGYSPVRSKQFYRDLTTRLASRPGVDAVGFANIGLLEGNEWDSTITIEGYEARPGESMNPYCNAVSPGYFKTLGTPILAGRDFDERDAILTPTQPSPTEPPSFKAAIVNRRFVKHYFGDRNPIGRHIGFGGNPGTKTPIEIIGVVQDSKYTGVRDDIPRQVFFAFLEGDFAASATVYIRSRQDPTAAFGAARRAVQELEPNMPLYNLRTLERQIERSLVTDRLIATLSAAFGALATTLALIGLYGVMAYTVVRRTREIGLRMALGAASGDVVWLVMREVLWLVGSGVAAGLFAAWGLSRFVQNQLYGIAPNDPLTIAAAASALGVVALLAGYVPARRATRVNPVLALRCE